MLIVGAGNLAGEIASRVRVHKELGIQLVGCLKSKSNQSEMVAGVPVLGDYEDLSKILDEKSIDQIIIALPFEDNQLLPKIVKGIGDNIVDIKIVPDIYRFVSVGGSIEEFEGLPVINIQDSPLSGFNLNLKRVFDIIFASLSLLILSPLLLLVALGTVHYALT